MLMIKWKTSGMTSAARYSKQVIYSVSIKSFPDYKYLLKENYLEYKHFFLNVTQLKKFFFTTH